MISDAPLWLHAISIQLGRPEYDRPDGGHRWTWAKAEFGVRIDRRTHAWVVFAWSSTRSASLRSASEPSAADLASAASLAGLCGPHSPERPPAVRFTPGIASVPEGSSGWSAS